MNSESNNLDKSTNPDKREQQDNANATETANRERMSRLADELAFQAKERQLRYDRGHDIFTK